MNKADNFMSKAYLKYRRACHCKNKFNSVILISLNKYFNLFTCEESLKHVVIRLYILEVFIQRIPLLGYGKTENARK